MATLKFSTNINCGGCVRTVSGFLDEVQNIKWDVDTGVAEKTLTVEGDNIQAETIIQAVENAGFNIQLN